MMTWRMGKMVGGGWSGRGLLGLTAGLVLVLSLSNCKVIEEEEGDEQSSGLNGMHFVLVPAGTFDMGSPDSPDGGELGRSDNEALHEVTITNAFYLQDAEVTQDQWQQIMGDNPSTHASCPQCPVTNVTWDEVQDFITEYEQRVDDGTTYRLPTEAEWEYATRANSSAPFANGDITELGCDENILDSNLEKMGWYCANSNEKSHEVKGKLANDFDLYDMHGNVAEWVQDRYQEVYDAGPLTDPTGPDTGDNRVARGGGFDSQPATCRSAARAPYLPSHQADNLGFRLVQIR